ncbi:MAG: 3-dehydroquinate synthase [Gammaproteobacteria bacterium]
MKQSIGIHIPAPLKQHYDVHLGEGLLSEFPALLPAHLQHFTFIIITDDTVKELYAAEIVSAFKQQGKKVEVLSFPPGEDQKCVQTKIDLETAMFKNHLGRDTCIIALGGGIVGDIAGFVAATYMRGIPYIQVPTTLLAMLDSSIGGKTGINTPEGKNLIGAFWHPVCVISDLNCLKTLPVNQMTCGWIEALKIFMICDETTFKEACQVGKPAMRFIKKAIELKAEVVARDPHENGPRAILNFGHTIGHALEKASHHKILHGHAVGYGMLVESHIALQRDLITKKDRQIIVDALEHVGIKGSALSKFKPEAILRFTRNDKKAQSQEVRYVLLHNIGRTYAENSHHTHPVTDNEVMLALTSVIEGDAHGRK